MFHDAQTAANNGNHDPRLLYNIVLGSSRAHYISPRKDARNDVIAVDVMRHRRRGVGDKIDPQLLARAQLQLFTMNLSKSAKGLD